MEIEKIAKSFNTAEKVHTQGSKKTQSKEKSIVPEGVTSLKVEDFKTEDFEALKSALSTQNPQFLNRLYHLTEPRVSELLN